MRGATSIESFDVIVIGGGPSGLFTSSLLTESGIKTALIEKESEIGKDVVCSGVISKEAFERYDLPENAIVGRLKDAELFSPGGVHIPYSHPQEAVVVVDRHKFDGELGKTAANNGAHIMLRTKVSSLQVKEDYVEAQLKTPKGEKQVRSKIAVIATGVSFNLQSSLGVGRPKKITKGIQIEVIAQDVKRLQIYWGSKVSNGYFGWAIPLHDGRTRVGVMTDGDALEGLKHILEEVGPYTNLCTDIGRIKRRGISFGAISKSYSDRVIAVGEAAGIVKTTTGGGIYYGLISAEIASTVIKEAFIKEDFSAKSLSKYEKLWQKDLGAEIKFGRYFHRFYSKLNDDSIDTLFDAAKKDGLLSFISENGKFDWHKDAVVQILKSPNLRKVLLWEAVNTARANIAL
jgi:digeranylgeranylglycerophospholipid reductase